jgi:hypothetical protein
MKRINFTIVIFFVLAFVLMFLIQIQTGCAAEGKKKLSCQVGGELPFTIDINYDAQTVNGKKASFTDTLITWWESEYGVHSTCYYLDRYTGDIKINSATQEQGKEYATMSNKYGKCQEVTEKKF